MTRTRVFSQYTLEAVKLLGSLIKTRRIERRWPESELAERVGISRMTVQRIERGDPGCSIGLVCEAATIVGIPLFGADRTEMSAHLVRAEHHLSLLPKSARKTGRSVDDDF